MNTTAAQLAALARRRLAAIHPRRRRDDVLIAIVLLEEGPEQHIRNALQILRWTIDHDEPLIGNGCPAVAVPVTSLARMQARLEAAIEQLEPAPEKDQPDYRTPLMEGRTP